jgi:hypothetical protein
VPVRARITTVVLAGLLVALAFAVYQLRRDYIRSFFVQGAGGAPAPALASGPGAGLDRVDRVRVVLIDGVDAATARTMPRYHALCEAGADYQVDVGFPTVSLPVQRVLWTGLTQQQTGILFFYKLLDPPDRGIPGQVPGSVAIAESHGKIVGSLGFAEVEPEPPGEPPWWSRKVSWRPWLDMDRQTEFTPAAVRAVTSDAPLAFVHILRTDSVAHRAGRASDAFRASAAWADRLLGELVDRDRAAHPDTRWFVLADHGHRAGGGHGGAEPRIRVVRGCIAGPLPPELPRRGYLHLVDYSRAIADSVGATLDDRSAGRPLAAALAAPVDRDATLPRPGTGRWAVALLLLLAAAVATGWAARGRWLALPWWWPIAYLSLILIELTPSLSTHMIYKADGRIIYQAALPGLALLAVTSALALRRLRPLRVAVAQLALPAALALGALILTGGAPQLWGAATEPPLMPIWTGHASAFLVLLFTGAVVVALALLATAVPFGIGRTTPSETGDRAA